MATPKLGPLSRKLSLEVFADENEKLAKSIRELAEAGDRFVKLDQRLDKIDNVYDMYMRKTKALCSHDDISTWWLVHEARLGMELDLISYAAEFYLNLWKKDQTKRVYAGYDFKDPDFMTSIFQEASSINNTLREDWNLFAKPNWKVKHCKPGTLLKDENGRHPLLGRFRYLKTKTIVEIDEHSPDEYNELIGIFEPLYTTEIKEPDNCLILSYNSTDDKLVVPTILDRRGLPAFVPVSEEGEFIRDRETGQVHLFREDASGPAVIRMYPSSSVTTNELTPIYSFEPPFQGQFNPNNFSNMSRKILTSWRTNGGASHTKSRGMEVVKAGNNFRLFGDYSFDTSRLEDAFDDYGHAAFRLYLAEYGFNSMNCWYSAYHLVAGAKVFITRSVRIAAGYLDATCDDINAFQCVLKDYMRHAWVEAMDTDYGLLQADATASVPIPAEKVYANRKGVVPEWDFGGARGTLKTLYEIAGPLDFSVEDEELAKMKLWKNDPRLYKAMEELSQHPQLGYKTLTIRARGLTPLPTQLAWDEESKSHFPGNCYASGDPGDQILWHPDGQWYLQPKGEGLVKLRHFSTCSYITEGLGFDAPPTFKNEDPALPKSEFPKEINDIFGEVVQYVNNAKRAKHSVNFNQALGRAQLELESLAKKSSDKETFKLLKKGVEAYSELFPRASKVIDELDATMLTFFLAARAHGFNVRLGIHAEKSDLVEQATGETKGWMISKNAGSRFVVELGLSKMIDTTIYGAGFEYTRQIWDELSYLSAHHDKFSYMSTLQGDYSKLVNAGDKSGDKEPDTLSKVYSTVRDNWKFHYFSGDLYFTDDPDKAYPHNYQADPDIEKKIDVYLRALVDGGVNFLRMPEKKISVFKGELITGKSRDGTNSIKVFGEEKATEYPVVGWTTETGLKGAPVLKPLRDEDGKRIFVESLTHAQFIKVNVKGSKFDGFYFSPSFGIVLSIPNETPGLGGAIIQSVGRMYKIKWKFSTDATVNYVVAERQFDVEATEGALRKNEQGSMTHEYVGHTFLTGKIIRDHLYPQPLNYAYKFINYVAEERLNDPNQIETAKSRRKLTLAYDLLRRHFWKPENLSDLYAMAYVVSEVNKLGLYKPDNLNEVLSKEEAETLGYVEYDQVPVPAKGKGLRNSEREGGLNYTHNRIQEAIAKAAREMHTAMVGQKCWNKKPDKLNAKVMQLLLKITTGWEK